mmetsp:Transcript_7453/g.17875  ORF Transcript_7453/g.17875 Transcript_7453/m.17875 type:complete len:403 (-) Transcript_7453:1527-2735(-)
MKFWKSSGSDSDSDSDSDRSSSSSAGEDGAEENVITTESEGAFQTPTKEPSRPLSFDPDEAWRQISSTQTFANIPYTNSSEKKDPNCVRLVCISDTHGKHRDVQLPPGDILIHGGDFSKSGETGSMKDLSAYFQESGFNEVICIAGNHDLPLHPEFYKEKWKRFHRTPFDIQDAKDSIKNCQYLEDSSYTSQRGIEIYGSPWSPFFFDWAFNLYRGQEIMEKWKLIPNLTDILITHGPPLGRGDLTCNEVRAGCYDLLVEIQERIVPRVHIFGHIHEGSGVTYDSKTLYINASNLNISYQAVNYPVVVDLPVDKNQPPKIVRPNCTLKPQEFEEWCTKENFNLVANAIAYDDEKMPQMPSGNDLFTEDAYADIVNLLHLHRDRKACIELKNALAKLYAQSFE